MSCWFLVEGLWGYDFDEVNHDLISVEDCQLEAWRMWLCLMMWVLFCLSSLVAWVGTKVCIDSSLETWFASCWVVFLVSEDFI